MTRSLALALAMLALAPAAVARDISGQMAYRERIALAPDAQLVVELRGAAGIVAEARIDTEGRQVPLPFTIVAPDAGAYTLQGTILIGGQAEWLSAPVAIAEGEGALDLGLVQLARHVPMAFASRMDCGGTVVEIGYVGQSARLRIGDEVFDLPQAMSASGARYSDGASPETVVWSKGDAAMVTVRGVDLPECRPVIDPGLLPLKARGNEPGWTLDLAETGFLYLGAMGETRIEGAMPSPFPTENGVRFEVSDAFGFEIERRLCRDSMTGMPYPVSVSVTDNGAVLPGCGGQPADLLAGTWTVVHVEGVNLPDDIAITMEFDADSGRISGSGGCNRYNGGFTLTGEGLSFGPAASTMMACPEDKMKAEMAFFKALDSVERFDLASDGTLEFLASGKVTMRARR